MIHYLIIIVFMLSIAVASGSIVISSHLKTTYKSNFFSTLIFFLSFYFTFGFYALWGQLMVSSFLLSFVTPELLKRITDIMFLLGSPFIVFASLMFVRLAREISGRKTGNTFVLAYIFTNVLIIVAFGYIMVELEHIQTLILRYYFVSLIILFTVFGVYYLLFPGKSRSVLRSSDLIKLSIGLVSLMLIQNTVLRFYNNNTYFALLFIFTYFLYGGFIPIFLKYSVDLSGLIPRNGNNLSFEHFCDQYSISRREKEVINEICKGLSNQQIADKLFISLQTVKDHTHRIYSKTECASRARLIRMVSEGTEIFPQ